MLSSKEGNVQWFEEVPLVLMVLRLNFVFLFCCSSSYSQQILWDRSYLSLLSEKM